MSLAAIVTAMAASGCSAEQIASAVRAAEAERETADEQRRQKLRENNNERQKRHRQRNANNALSRVTGVTERDNRDPLSPKEIPPTPPKEITPFTLQNPVSASALTAPFSPKAKSDFPTDGFETFWRTYPRREAKGAARKAWEKIQAKAKVRFSEIMQGAERFARDPPEPQFIPHAATWLNAERWSDEPHRKNGNDFSAAIRELHAEISEREDPQPSTGSDLELFASEHFGMSLTHRSYG